MSNRPIVRYPRDHVVFENNVPVAIEENHNDFCLRIETSLLKYMTADSYAGGSMEKVNMDNYLTEPSEVPLNGFIDMVNLGLNVSAMIRREQIVLLNIVKLKLSEFKTREEATKYIEQVIGSLVVNAREEKIDGS